MSGVTINKTTTMDPNDLIIIGYDTDDNETHELYDERAFYDLDPDFVKNIQYLGITETVTVREVDGKVVVVTGRQRVKAAREINKTNEAMGISTRIKVPVGIHGVFGSDKTTIMSRIYAENAFRKEDDVVVKARKIARIFRQCNDMDEVAIAVGLTKTTVHNYLKIAEADDSIHSALLQDKMSLVAAYYLCTHFSASQQREVLMTLLKRAGSIKISDELVKNYHKELIGVKTYDPDVGILGGDDDESDEVGKDEEKEGFADGFDPDSDDPFDGPEDKKPIKTSDSTRQQDGLSKSWLRKALSSDTAKDLDDEQRGVLYWLVHGTNENSKVVGWWNQFHVKVVREFKEKKAKKKEKKAKKSDDSGDDIV